MKKKEDKKTNEDVKEKKKSVTKKVEKSKIVEESKVEEPKVIEDKKNKKSLYISYQTRLAFYIILFLISFLSCLYFAMQTLEREKLTPIPYTQKSNIDYKVYLNENDFYEQEYLEMNKAYIASLIKAIDINYNYLFQINDVTNIEFDYQILADLVIENNGGNKRYFEKTYTLLDTQKKKLKENKEINIKENIQIDYDYYNHLANSFRSTYGVDTNSYLNVYLNIKVQSDEELNYIINENNQLNLRIPLSEKAIEISFDSNNKEITKSVIPDGKVFFNTKYLIIEIILLIISSVLLIIIIKKLMLLSRKVTAYDKYVNKILKEYDRLIVVIHNSIDFTKYNVIKIKDFDELLDVRDNLKEPILYYNIIEHEKGVFYIKNDEDIYLLTIKNIDLEK